MEKLPLVFGEGKQTASIVVGGEQPGGRHGRGCCPLRLDLPQV